jgi:hypothetical protein
MGSVASWFSERCEASSGDGACAPPHHEDLVTQQRCYVMLPGIRLRLMASADEPSLRKVQVILPGMKQRIEMPR